mgnify:CR=1 FL=1
MGTALNALDNMVSQNQAKGPAIRSFMSYLSANTTAATTTSGYTSGQRFPDTITVQSVGAGVSGGYVTGCELWSSRTVCCVIALETTLGTLTVSGNSFAGGSAMPTKTVAGTSLTTATLIPVIVVTTALTATTPILTITYTDQDGNTGQTATMTLPTNPVINSAFLVAPHLAAGDTGVRAVTGLSISTGSAGTLRAFGLLPIVLGFVAANVAILMPSPLATSLPMFLCEANEVIAVYNFGTALTSQIRADLTFVAEN